MFQINKHFIIQPMHNIHDDSVARGPKLLFVYTVEQREFLFRKYWQTGSFKACQTAFRMEMVKDVHHRSVASRNWLKIYRQGEVDLTPADFFLWGLLKGKVCKNTPHTQRRYTPRDSSRQRRQFGKNIPEFGETHSTVLGCERRPVSASIVSRSCFASFPVCVYKLSSNYLNNSVLYTIVWGL